MRLKGEKGRVRVDDGKKAYERRLFSTIPR